MIFAAKEAVERRAKERLKKQTEEARKEGVAEGREQIRTELEKRGMLTPEIIELLEELSETQS